MNQVVFGNKKGLLVTNTEFRNEIISTLKNKWNLDELTNRNAYKNVDQSTLSFFKQKNYMVAAKSIGSLNFLYLTTYKDRKYCLFINWKNKKIISARLKFKDEVFNGTLFEGEMVKDNDDYWFFLIYNVICFKNNSINSRIYDKYNLMYQILDSYYTHDPWMNSCEIQIKRLFYLNELNSLMKDFLPSLSYKVSSLIFYPTETSGEIYIYNIENQTYTKSEADNNSSDSEEEDIEDITAVFELNTTDLPDIYNLHASKNGISTKCCVAYINTMSCSKMVKNILLENTKPKIECKFNDKFKKWIPVKKVTNSTRLSDLKNIEKIMN